MTKIHPRVLAFAAFVLLLLVAIKFNTTVAWLFCGMSLGYFAAVNKA